MLNVCREVKFTRGLMGVLILYTLGSPDSLGAVELVILNILVPIFVCISVFVWVYKFVN